MTDLQAGYGPGSRDPIERRRWLPITEDEACILGGMSEDERAHWFASLSRQEKRARFRAAERSAKDKP
jgi:hypothetical protein